MSTATTTKEVGMKAYDERATYAAKVISQELGGKAEDPQLLLTIAVQGKHVKAYQPDKGVLPLPEGTETEKAVYLRLTPNTNRDAYKYAMKDLRALGFQGENVERLLPDYSGRDKFSLVGKVLCVRVKYKPSTSGPGDREFWNFATPDPTKRTGCSSAEARQAIQATSEDATLVFNEIDSIGEDSPY